MLFDFQPLESRLQFSTPVPAPTPDPVLRPAGKVSSQDLLPDLTPWASRPKGYMYHWSLDRKEKPGRVLLRLTTAIANTGRGPLEIFGGSPHEGGGQNVYQRIYNARGGATDRLAGVFTYHPEHHHTHMDDFAIFRLREVTSDRGVGRVIRAGRKVSFCLVDTDIYNLSLPNAPSNGEYFDCSSRKQGISVGWADVYSQWLPDQWIDITGMKPGKYWLEVVADPDNRLLESNEKNNTRRVLIHLKRVPPPLAKDTRGDIGAMNFAVHPIAASPGNEADLQDDPLMLRMPSYPAKVVEDESARVLDEVGS